MADSSLDDFFAKKDKTKKKQKNKGDGDDSSKQTKKDKKRKEKESGLGLGMGNNILNTQEDDEWKDFEEEKKADYTGLRIQTLQIASKEDQEKESGDGEDDGDDEDGESRGKKDGASGPWAVSNSTATEPAQPVASIPEASKEPAPGPAVPKGPAKYIPPAQRHAAASGASTPATVVGPRRKKEAPNMNSEVDFPTLGGAPARTQGSYDYIDTTGGRKGVNLTLENKFSALQD